MSERERDEKYTCTCVQGMPRDPREESEIRLKGKPGEIIIFKKMKTDYLWSI